MTATLTPRAGKIDDIRREDDSRGYERDETDSLHQLGTLLLMMAERDDACVLCGFWTCRCGQNAAAPAPTPSVTGTIRSAAAATRRPWSP
ncbi:hypothetical protein ACWENO_19755 [Streptomyces sp. NPDC004436]